MEFKDRTWRDELEKEFGFANVCPYVTKEILESCGIPDCQDFASFVEVTGDAEILALYGTYSTYTDKSLYLVWWNEKGLGNIYWGNVLLPLSWIMERYEDFEFEAEDNSVYLYATEKRDDCEGAKFVHAEKNLWYMVYNSRDEDKNAE